MTASVAIAAVALALAAALGSPAAASAQSLPGLIGSLAGGDAARPLEPEEEQRAFETASDSFRHAARELTEEVARSASDATQPPAEVLSARVEDAVRGFEGAARERLIARKGDGVLTLGELTTALSEVREERMAALEERLRAEWDDTEPPPKRDRFENSFEYAVAMSRYTFVERNTGTRWALVVGALILGLVLAGLAARGLARMPVPTDRRGGRMVARAAASLSGPLYLAAVAIALRAALGWIWLPIGAHTAVEVGTSALLAVAALWIAWNGAAGVAGALAWGVLRTRGRIDDEAVDLIRKGLRIGALAVFGAFVVEALFGANLSAIFAALGVAGIIASIAAQDTLRNVVASFTIYGARPFVVGDLIRFQDHFGTVEEIGFRSTFVRRLDGHKVVFPNAEIIREPLENVSARPFVRHHYAIDLIYATPPERVERAVEILEEILTDSDPPEGQPPHVSFEEFGAHSLRIALWYCSDTSDYWEAQRHRTEVNLRILARFNEEGLEFAFPTRSIVVDSNLANADEATADA